MTRLVLALLAVLLVDGGVQSRPLPQAAPGGKAPPPPPVKLEAGKAILQKGERLILPKGTVVRKEHVAGEADLEVRSLHLIPAKKEQWEYEVRPVGRTHLRLKPERGALKGVSVVFAGKRGELAQDTILGSGFAWLEQPYEIRDRAGKVLFRSKGKAGG